MKCCPVCGRKIIWIKSTIQTEDNRALYFNYWRCNSCKKNYIEIIDDEGNVLSVLVTKEKIKKTTVQSTFDDFG